MDDYSIDVNNFTFLFAGAIDDLAFADYFFVTFSGRVFFRFALSGSCENTKL